MPSYRSIFIVLSAAWATRLPSATAFTTRSTVPAFTPSTRNSFHHDAAYTRWQASPSPLSSSPSQLFVSSDVRPMEERRQQRQAALDSEGNEILEAVVTSDPTNGSGTTAMIMPNSNNNNQLLDAVVFANGSVLAFVGTAILYSLFHAHVEALVALWEYDLGQLDSPELTKLAVAVEVILRMPLDWLHAYEELVPTNPIFYKACTSGVAYCLGDFISQIYQGSRLKTLDLPRSLRSGAAGFIGHGPLCHYWLLCMETYLDFGGAWWATGLKVTADLTVWSIFLNFSYSFIIGTLALRKPQDVWEDIKITSWPALRSAWRFWPFVHTISFSHAVPLDLKLLWVDVMEVVWVTILSKVANEDKNARLEANPELQPNPDASKNIPEVDPALEIELTREAELSGSSNSPNLAFELPQKVLAACWPLLVMWPFLYGGYRIEKLLGLEV